MRERQEPCLRAEQDMEHKVRIVPIRVGVLETVLEILDPRLDKL